MNEPVVATSECNFSQEFSDISFVFHVRLIYLHCCFGRDCMLKIWISRHVLCSWNAFLLEMKTFSSFYLLKIINSRHKRTHFDSFKWHTVCYVPLLHIIWSQRPFCHLKGMTCTINRLLCASMIFFWLRYPFSSLAERATVCHLHPCGAAQMWLLLIPALWCSHFRLRRALHG